jgi:hypothetical protein
MLGATKAIKREIEVKASKFANFPPSGEMPEISPEGTKREPRET